MWKALRQVLPDTVVRVDYNIAVRKRSRSGPPHVTDTIVRVTESLPVPVEQELSNWVPRSGLLQPARVGGRSLTLICLVVAGRDRTTRC